METIISGLLSRLPDFAGLAIAVFILYQQNNRLLDALLQRVERLETKVDTLQREYSEQVFDS
jgi:uncharacterized protein Yka (UPF0111/DUF47 family)